MKGLIHQQYHHFLYVRVIALCIKISPALLVLSQGGVPGALEPNHKLNNAARYNPPEHQGAPERLPYSHTNGHSCHPAAQHESGLSDERSAEEDSSEEEADDEEEEEEYSPKWKGIEAIVEAYQEYIDGEFYYQVSRWYCGVPVLLKLWLPLHQYTDGCVCVCVFLQSGI